MLTPAAQNRYIEVIQNKHTKLQETVSPEEAVTKIIQGINVGSAIGPDMLQTTMLRKCADVLAKPIRMLALLMLQQCVLPQAWMTHWIVQLF